MPPLFVPIQATKTYHATKGKTKPDEMFMSGYYAVVSIYTTILD